jgi:hypothetical protein
MVGCKSKLSPAQFYIPSRALDDSSSPVSRSHNSRSNTKVQPYKLGFR